jgi:hypothetical protein
MRHEMANPKRTLGPPLRATPLSLIAAYRPHQTDLGASGPKQVLSGRLAGEIEVVREARIEGVELALTRRTESRTRAKARF